MSRAERDQVKIIMIIVAMPSQSLKHRVWLITDTLLGVVCPSFVLMLYVQ